MAKEIDSFDIFVEDIMSSAVKGINEMFSTTRGAARYGASAKAEIDAEDTEQIKITTAQGVFWLAI